MGLGRGRALRGEHESNHRRGRQTKHVRSTRGNCPSDRRGARGSDGARPHTGRKRPQEAENRPHFRPPDPSQLVNAIKKEPWTREHDAKREAASAGAQWVHCRLQHGPGLCEVDRAGEDRHCPAWKPFERTGQDEVEGATAEPDRLPPNEELRCVGVGHAVWGPA